MKSRAEGFCLLRQWRVLAHDHRHKKQKEDFSPLLCISSSALLLVLCSPSRPLLCIPKTHKIKKDDSKSSSFSVGAKGFELRSSRADTSKRRHNVSSNKLLHIGSTPPYVSNAYARSKIDRKRKDEEQSRRLLFIAAMAGACTRP